MEMDIGVEGLEFREEMPSPRAMLALQAYVEGRGPAVNDSHVFGLKLHFLSFWM